MRTAAAKSQYQTIAIASIHESTTNPRRTFDETKLAELAESLRVQGLIQPITVRPNDRGYEIVAGARRFRAAQLAEFEEIVVRIVSLSDEQALEWQLIENSQRVDIHPYEEAQGFQRLLDLPGYDVAALTEKTGKSESLIYSRLTLLQLIPDVADAFQSERITVSHANLIARLPQDHQHAAFDACWRKDYQDKEAHLLPTKYLSAWIANNVYLPLEEAPFDREDGTLNAAAGACSACPRRSGHNSSLFSDVAGDQCLDSDCYHAKLTAHIEREVAARPDLVQIETDYRSPSDRKPGTLSRSQYTAVDVPNLDEGEGEPTMPCDASKPAIITYGEGAGTMRTVCTDPECPVHRPNRIEPVDPDFEQRKRERGKEQERRKRLMKRRLESFARILDNAPSTFTAPQLRVVLRAFINIEGYGCFEEVAAQYGANDENRLQSAEEILLSVADRLEDDQLPQFALRLTLTAHTDIPEENAIDPLAEAEKVFLLEKTKQPATKKKLAKKPSSAKVKTAKKKKVNAKSIAA